MNINPGELNKKIQIVKITGEENESGFCENQIETLIREPFAKITKTNVSTIMKAGQEINISRRRFLVRYSKKNIERGMFVKYKGKYYRIEYTNNYGDSNEYIEIMTEAGESGG